MSYDPFLTLMIRIAEHSSFGVVPSDFVTAFVRVLRGGKNVDPTGDERVDRLNGIICDLQASIEAVQSLKTESIQQQRYRDELAQSIVTLRAEKEGTEALAKVPEEVVLKTFAKAQRLKQGAVRLEGLAIGFVTGIGSSLVVWIFTR